MDLIERLRCMDKCGCGGIPIVLHRGPLAAFAQCEACGKTGPKGSAPWEAMIYWNRQVRAITAKKVRECRTLPPRY